MNLHEIEKKNGYLHFFTVFQPSENAKFHFRLAPKPCEVQAWDYLDKTVRRHIFRTKQIDTKKVSKIYKELDTHA